MKTINHNFLVMIALIIVLFGSCSDDQKSGVKKADLKGMKAPEVNHATLDLKMPEALKQEDTLAPMSKDTSGFVYRIAINNKKPADKLSVRGTVETVEKGNLIVKTEQGQLQLQFFIPKDELLYIEKGDKIKITTNDVIKDASFNRLLQVENSNGIVISSGRVTDSSPIQIVINKYLSIQQTSYNEKMIISDSEYETYFSTPVFLINNGQRKSVEMKKEVVFENSDIKYKLIIQLSSFSIPKPEYQSSSEGQGYFLEYLLYIIK